jgi:hypothetical protein
VYTLNELQIKAIHAMLGAEDFLSFRDALYKTLIVTKFKNISSDLDPDAEVGLSRKECHLVETCLEMFKSFNVTDEYAVEKSFYLLKSLLLHFQMTGLKESTLDPHSLEQDKEYQLFVKENLINKIDVLKTDFNNLQTFNTYFTRQQTSLEKYCRQELRDCYELINGLCEG